MAKTPDKSTDNAEYRHLILHDQRTENTLFTFIFKITKKEVSFTLILNPKLKGATIKSKSAANEETVYKFSKDDSCDLLHETKEGYFVRGKLRIITFENPVGQFAEGYKNIFFNVDYGQEADRSGSHLQGLFLLIDPSQEPDDSI